MNTLKTLVASISLIGLLMLSHQGHGQLVVNGKDLNADPELEYIQLMYYIDKASIKPVFYVDHGFIEPDYNDIVKPEEFGRQVIGINGEEVTDKVTVVWVLNKLHRAGWEYLGDVVFVQLRVMNDWHVYTLRRKPNARTQESL